MAQTLIGARVAPMDVSRAARRSDFMGTDSRASVVRYALARVAGYAHTEAKQIAAGQPLNGLGDAGMVVHGKHITAKIDDELLALAESRMQELGISDRATLIRYALARAAEFDHEEALDEATRKRTGRPPKNREAAA